MTKQPEYQISTSHNEGILEIVITGDVESPAVADAIHNEVLATLKTAEAKALLVDVRLLKGRMDFGDTYLRVRKTPHTRGLLGTAVVDTNQHAKFHSFHQTVASNYGFNTRWFTGIDEARAWLKSLETSEPG
ncbi:MAG: hypothetical protein HZA88_15315 [Verrucomicrobia bacterium]|nr:hypothetical protein [Verrucomicrobiota bacterium]